MISFPRTLAAAPLHFIHRGGLFIHGGYPNGLVCARACYVRRRGRLRRRAAAAAAGRLPANVGFGLALAGLVVLFESRLRETAITRVLGALIGCAVGLGIAHVIGAGLFWADTAIAASSSSTASC